MTWTSQRWLEHINTFWPTWINMVISTRVESNMPPPNQMEIYFLPLAMETNKQIRSYKILTKWCWINASPLYLKRLPIICYWKNQEKTTTQNQAQTQSMHNKDRRHCFSPASQMFCCQRSIGRLSEIEFFEEHTNHYQPMLECFGFEPICWPKIINNSW